jgi:ATP-dependent Clp protease ATP-binding subunit ClpC
LHRAIQKYLEDPLAEEILSLNLKQGDTMIADLNEDKTKIKFTLKSPTKEKSEA